MSTSVGYVPDPYPAPTRTQVRTWRRYLANERAEERTYRALAGRRRGEEREILLGLAEAEGRHQAHWEALLGEHVGRPRRADFRTWALSVLARVFGSVFVLALAQQAEARSPYDDEEFASDTMAADEKIHGEVVRALAERGRAKISGNFRAAVFGANDGLVSNLALVLGVGAAGVTSGQILLTGLSGLLAGALSMAAGEFVSVRSQRELLDASTPDPAARSALAYLDVNANELALVYRARGMDAEQATALATEVMAEHPDERGKDSTPEAKDLEELGTGLNAAVSSFAFFATGAAIPVLPYLFGMEGLAAVAVAAGLVGIALMGTGSVVGLLSGRPPLGRALRQLAIGYGAAGATYLLGLLFGTTIA